MMTCKSCKLSHPPTDFSDGSFDCDDCRAENIRRQSEVALRQLMEESE